MKKTIPDCLNSTYCNNQTSELKCNSKVGCNFKSFNMEDNTNNIKSVIDVNTLLTAGLPSAIKHKKWSEIFYLIKDGDKVGYANKGGWFFHAETKDEFIEQYSTFHNRGVIKPYRGNLK
jgi:hypothetical protein